MSGHDNLDSGDDQQWPSADASKLSPSWTDESWLDFVNSPSDDTGKFDFMDESMDTDNDNTLSSVPAQEGPTLDDQMLNGAGSVNDDIIQSQFPDQPRFASPPAQIFGAEEMSNVPPASTNQANGQSIHAALPAQLMSHTSHVNYDFNSYNAQGLNSTGADLQQQYPSIAAPGAYPVPQQQFFGGTWSQQYGYAMAGADATYPCSNFQALPAGNYSFGSQLQGGSLNASNGFSHLAAPPVLRKLAPKPSPDVVATAPMIQDYEDDAEPVPPPVAPKKKEPKAKEPKVNGTAQKKKPTTSNAKKPAVKFTLYDPELRVTSLEDANRIVEFNRIKLEVVDDDFEVVRAQKKHFVTSIVKALDVDFRRQAEGHEKLSKEGRDEFTRWQEEHENKVWAWLNQEEIKNAPEYAQACALILYHMILEAHQSKFIAHPGKAISNGSVDVTMKCSERINAAITAIGEYSIVKYDFLRRERLGALLATPKGFVGRKVENMLNNYKKKDDGPVKEVDETDSAVAPKGKGQGQGKGQGKRKRKEPSPLAKDDEGEDEGEVEGQGDEEFVRPIKPIKRTRRN